MKLNQKENGAVLIVGLLILLLTTMVALSSMQNSNLQARMAANSQEDNRAFQAAESVVEVYRNDILDADKKWMATDAVTQYISGGTDWPTTSATVYDNEITNDLQLEVIGEDAPSCLAKSVTAEEGAPVIPCYALQYRSTSTVAGSNASVTVVQGFTLN